MKIVGIIPARYGSTRFPGKPLAMIHGKSMIRRVYEKASKAESLSMVVVATDDDRIRKEVESFGGKVMMTSPKHSSGTERCGEVIHNLGEAFDVAVNIQGDEPFIDPETINLLCGMFQNSGVEIATLASAITGKNELINPNVVKVVTTMNDKALYFSRSVIPFLRDEKQSKNLETMLYRRHVGIYAYRCAVLQKIVTLEPSPLEKAESLEQLRWLENGFSIFVSETKSEGFAVDTPEDLSKIINM